MILQLLHSEFPYLRGNLIWGPACTYLSKHSSVLHLHYIPMVCTLCAGQCSMLWFRPGTMNSWWLAWSVTPPPSYPWNTARLEDWWDAPSSVSKLTTFTPCTPQLTNRAQVIENWREAMDMSYLFITILGVAWFLRAHQVNCTSTLTTVQIHIQRSKPPSPSSIRLYSADEHCARYW